jgi:hypothetical protein
MKFSVLGMTAFVLMSLFISSCDGDGICIDGSGAIESRTLSLPSFKGIELEEAANIYITQGSTQEVRVTGHANIINRLQTDVVQDVWEIDLGRGCFDHYELTIFITLPNLDNIWLRGSGDIFVGEFTGQHDLALSITGSGKINLNRFEGCQNLSARISGSGTIIGGDVFPALSNLDIDISGSGDYDAFAIQSKVCHVKISGSGDCRVSVEDRLDVDITGSGKVYYKGHPSITDHITGSGELIDAN